jgi:hypothetical protein
MYRYNIDRQSNDCQDLVCNNFQKISFEKQTNYDILETQKLLWGKIIFLLLEVQ